MTVAKKLTWVAAGYGLAVVGGIAAVLVNEARISQEVHQTSGGMVAFGDMILFVLAAGFFSLAPTWFLLKLCVAKIPRTLLIAELVIAVTGPMSWLATRLLAAGPSPHSLSGSLGAVLGLSVALVGLPRMVFGPVLLVIEGATFNLAQGRAARTLLVGAMLMDVIPLSLFAMHMAAAIHR